MLAKITRCPNPWKIQTLSVSQLFILNMEPVALKLRVFTRFCSPAGLQFNKHLVKHEGFGAGSQCAT